MYISNAPIETVILLFESKLEPNGQWTARLALVFPQNIRSKNLICLPNRWGQGPFLKHFLLCFSVAFRAKRAVKIVTARLALISI